MGRQANVRVPQGQEAAQLSGKKYDDDNVAHTHAKGRVARGKWVVLCCELCLAKMQHFKAAHCPLDQYQHPRQRLLSSVTNVLAKEGLEKS